MNLSRWSLITRASFSATSAESVDTLRSRPAKIFAALAQSAPQSGFRASWDHPDGRRERESFQLSIRHCLVLITSGITFAARLIRHPVRQHLRPVEAPHCFAGTAQFVRRIRVSFISLLNPSRTVRMGQQVDAFAHLAHDSDADRHQSRIPRSLLLHQKRGNPAFNGAISSSVGTDRPRYR